MTNDKRRVAIDYRDGTYCMFDPEPVPKEWMEKNTIEIFEDDWKEYQEVLETYYKWQRFIRVRYLRRQEKK